MNNKTMGPAKPPKPARVVYRITSASGDVLVTQSANTITARY